MRSSFRAAASVATACTSSVVYTYARGAPGASAELQSLTSTKGTPEELKRRPSDPDPPNENEVRELVRDWADQEGCPGYFPPDSSWPWPKEDSRQIPALRVALDKCGRAEQSECHEAAFRLATALLGGVDGHSSADDELDEQQRCEGAELMHRLAAVSRGARSPPIRGILCYLMDPIRRVHICTSINVHDSLNLAKT